MKSLATASLCLAFALLTFFQFPGHTWLQQDTQIYAPILEHLRDPGVLRNDIVVEQPHLAYSLYDEVALGLRAITGLGFREILTAQQIVTRALGIWGLLLLAQSMGLGWSGSIVVAAICSLGAVVEGPSVLTVEYEPTPRAFAIPLLLCAIGLAANGRYRAAGIAGAVAFLYHPPTALPFWIIWGLLCAWPAKGNRERIATFIPLGVAIVVLAIAAQWEPGTQTFFARISPALEAIQRVRASYVYSWTWDTSWLYLLMFAGLVKAFVRVRRTVGIEARAFLLGLPLIGLLSIPLSWLLLGHWKWSLIPQIQPMRTLLFVTLATQFLATVAGIRAGRSAAAVAWFTAAFLLSLPPTTWGRVALAIALGAAAALAGRWTPAVAVAAFFLIPWVGGVVNYPRQRTPELAQLSQWARSNTPKDAVFLFADAARGLDPGVFRTEALRPVYVDWKGGGQVNYLSGFAEQWWFRWQQVFRRPVDLPRYNGLGVRYVVLRKEHRLPRPTEYENGKYVVYSAGR